MYLLLQVELQREQKEIIFISSDHSIHNIYIYLYAKRILHNFYKHEYFLKNLHKNIQPQSRFATMSTSYKIYKKH